MTFSATCRDCPARFVAEFIAAPPAAQAMRAGWLLAGEQWVCPRCQEREATREGEGVRMPGFFDAQCIKCRKRFGWMGEIRDMPACPKCGYRAPQAELDADDAEVRRYRELLANRPLDSKGEVRRQQRVTSGLTLRHAAKLLSVTPSELSDYENDRRPLPVEIATAMADIYGLDDKETA